MKIGDFFPEMGTHTEMQGPVVNLLLMHEVRSPNLEVKALCSVNDII